MRCRGRSRCAGRVTICVMLGDALVRPGRVVVRLIFREDGERRCASPWISVRSRTSRRSVPMRRSQIAFILAAWVAPTRILVPAAWNTESSEAVKFEPRSRIRNLMSSNCWSRLRARFRACCTVHSPVGFAVTPPRCIRRPRRAGTAATSDPTGAAPDRCPQPAGSPTRWTARPSRRAWSARRGSGGVPTADSPWPGERPGGRCSGPSAGGRACAACSCRICCRPVLRCQASSVPGVTGKMSVQRLRGRSRASAANHTRSPGSYRIRPACPRSTAFSCRSTSSSASFAWSPRNTRTARPSTRHVSR